MKSTALLVAGATLALAQLTTAGAALAQSACTRPEAPAVTNGATATLDQMLAAKTAVSAFITASDTYQTCVLDDLNAQKAAAKAAKTKVAPQVQTAATAAMDANQADKEKVGGDYNAAAKAYKTAHPS